MQKDAGAMSRRAFTFGACSLGIGASTRGIAMPGKLRGRFRPGAAEAIRQVLRRHLDSGYAPGVTAIAAIGDEALTFAEGTLDQQQSRKARVDSLYRIASMTKPVTAVATLMLAEEGVLQLSDPAAKFLPELADPRVLRTPTSKLDDTVPARRHITIADILGSTFGHGIVLDDPPTPYQQALADLPGFGMPNPDAKVTPDEWMRRVGQVPLVAQPGSRWIYGASYCVLGALVARASGRSFPAFLEERIFGPLGMRETAFFAAPTSLPRMATAYLGENGHLKEFDPPAGAYSRPPRFPAGDSGLVSTAPDYLKFARFLTDGQTRSGRRLLSAASLAAMRRNHLSRAQIADAGIMLGGDRGWGYGVSIALKDSWDGLRKGAYGWNGGFGTSWFNDPVTGLTAILLSNRLFDSPQTPRMHSDFWRAAYGAIAEG